MFSICIRTEDKDLLNFLSFYGTRTKNHTFQFTSSERVIEPLSKYIFYKIKSECLAKLFHNQNKKELNSFLAFIPDEMEVYWQKRVEYDLMDYFSETDEISENPVEFHIEGFIVFRMREFKKAYYEYLLREYALFSDRTDSEKVIQSIKNYMSEQPFRADEIVIETKKNGQIFLKKHGKIVYKEPNNEQENIVLNVIFHAPYAIKIKDKHNILRKELVIILKQLFGRNMKYV